MVVKPHPATILPLAIFVETARRVLADAGFDPNVVQLAVDTPEEPIAADLVMNRAVRLVDYTGGAAFGDWLEQNASHAEVFTAKPGVNSVVIDSTPDLKGMIRNLSASVTMYSGQMCTTPQNIYIPTAGIDVDGEQVSFRELAAGLADAIGRSLADDPRASDILGAVKSPETLIRIDTAASSGEVLLESRRVIHPSFPQAEVRTPVVVKVDADARDVYMREVFGPVVFVIATADTDESLDLARQSAIDRGAINWLVYTANEEVMDAATDAAIDAGVAVAFNLTGGLYVNQSAAFSDLHATGANPAGTAALVGPGFVASRFRVVGVSVPA